MSERQKTRLIYVDDVEHCWCSKHKEYFPCEQFGKMKHSKTGYHHYCKQCIQGISNKNKIEQMNITEFIKGQSNIMLSNIGYDLSKPIYPQFLEVCRVKYGKVWD